MASDLKDGNNGILVGGVTLGAAIRGQGFVFDGATGYIDFGNGISYSNATQGAVAAWIKGTPPATTDPWATIFEHDRDAAGDYAVQLVANVASLAAEFTLFNGNYYTVYGVTPVLDGKWHHVVGQWNSTGMFLYVDGKLDNTNTLVVDLGAYGGGGARAGVIYWNGGLSNWFNGSIDELQTFDQALAAEDIATAFNACRPVETVPDLMEQTAATGLSWGLRRAFLVKLAVSLRLLDDGDRLTAVNQLQAFINQVEAQRDKALTDRMADALIRSAQRIIAALQAG